MFAVYSKQVKTGCEKGLGTGKQSKTGAKGRPGNEVNTCNVEV